MKCLTANKLQLINVISILNHKHLQSPVFRQFLPLNKGKINAIYMYIIVPLNGI